VVSDMYNLEEALDKALIAARLFKEELEIVKEENDSLYREMEKLKTFH